MSITLYINPGTNDLVILPGDKPQYTGGREQVQQRVIITLKHFYGEYFLNVPGGVPWYELILGSKDKALCQAILRYIILQVPGVSRILNFSFTSVSRQVSINTIIETPYGDVEVSFP